MADSSRKPAAFVSCRSQSLAMDQFKPLFHRPWESGIEREVNFEHLESDNNTHALSAAQQVQFGLQQPSINVASNMTKPRLGQDEVEILERAYLTNPKPLTQTKRQLADSMGVDLARINNWFQNRRAKERLEKKQVVYEEQQSREAVEGLALEQDLEISSPDHFYGSNQNHTDNDDSSITMRQDNTALPHGSVYSPQFCDPTASTLESLFRTLATIKTEQIKAYQGSTDQVQYTLDTQVAEANEMLHNEDDCTSVIRNSKGLLNRVDVPRQQVNVLPDVKSQAGPSSDIDVVSRDKHMSPTTNCTFDDTPTSGSSTPSSSGSWELLSRYGSFRHEDFALAKLQVLDPMRQALVERIIEEFSITYDQNWMCQTTQCGGGHPPTTKQLADCGSTGDIRLSPNSQNSCFKRQRNQDEDSADEDENRRQRKQGRRPANEPSDSRRFSCPFRKHNPQKYSIHSHRVCALTGWDTIARVKEHLYRNHKAAHYCKRCWNVFDTDDLKDQHTTVPADLICEAVPGEPPEGVTPKQVSELRSRAKPYSKLSESERWNEIFRLLFPGVNIPSPYWEPVQDHVIAPCSSPNLMLYNDYIYRELPRLVRSRVEEIVCREMQPIEATIFASLEHLVRECQTQLSSTYREKLPIGHDISSNSELAPNLDTDELINAAEGPGIVQDSPVDCFASVHQPPSSLEDGYVDDFAASELQLFASTFPFDIQSDSEDVSISQCPGKDECICLTATICREDPIADVAGPKFNGLHGESEPRGNLDLWHGWISDGFESHESGHPRDSAQE